MPESDLGTFGETQESSGGVKQQIAGSVIDLGMTNEEICLVISLRGF
jgi:hypothetical protein